MDIYARLKDDHGKQRGLAAALNETSGDDPERRRLFEVFKAEIEAHAAAEEETFYAALIADPKSQEQARHSVAEHKDAADLIEELENTDMSSSAWLTTFRKLKEELEHHLDEEEDDVFPLAKTVIAQDDAEAMGDAFVARKGEAIEA